MLLLVLVIIVLATSSAYAFARDSLLEVTRIRERSERAHAELLARSGQEIARRALADDAKLQAGPPELLLESTRDAWALLAPDPIQLPDGGEIQLRVRDSGSRINLNGLVNLEGSQHEQSPGFLEALLEHVIEEMPGRNEEKLYDARELAEAILDWIDSDKVTRRGDEATVYAERTAGALPPDRPLIALRELESVPGMDERLLDVLALYFTIHPLFPSADRVGVNPNTAPAHIMAAIWTPTDGQLLGRDDVFRALSRRADGRIFCAGQKEGCESFPQEILELREPFPRLQYQSSIFEIESEGRYGSARVRVVSVVDRSNPADIRTLYYRSN